jgi:hypothetical protein
MLFNFKCVYTQISEEKIFTIKNLKCLLDNFRLLPNKRLMACCSSKKILISLKFVPSINNAGEILANEKEFLANVSHSLTTLMQ